MANPYNEYESEQARQREQAQNQYSYPQASYDIPATGQTQNIQPGYQAGPQQLPPQQLPPQAFQGPHVQDLHSRSNLLALGLIIFGVFALFQQVFNSSSLNLEPGIILLTISSVFLFFAFWKRIYGLLIPGAILAGLSVGVTFADLTEGSSVLLGLAAGFFSIDMIGRLGFGVRGGWGSIVASILFVIGSLVLVLNLPSIFSGLGLILPLGLIGAGIWLGRNRMALP